MPAQYKVKAKALIVENSNILLIEYKENNRLHYNLPGGTVEPSETISQALIRELKEEACVEVASEKVFLLYEYVEHKQPGDYSPAVPGMIVFFLCKINNGTPQMPEVPDPNQVGVKWIPIDQLDNIVLFPTVKEQIKAYLKQGNTIDLAEGT